mgnify:CR=1 FL=1
MAPAVRPFALACACKAGKNSHLAAFGQTGDDVVGNGFSLLVKVHSDLGVQIAAGLFQSRFVYAGAKVDYLNAIFIALNDTRNQIGAINRGNNVISLTNPFWGNP